MSKQITQMRQAHAELFSRLQAVESENARLRLALTDAHDCTAEAKAQVKKDVMRLLNAPITCEVETYVCLMKAAIEAL